MRNWICGVALALASFGMTGIPSVSAAELRIQRISPDPMIIGNPLRITGTGFGEPGQRRIYYGAYGALGGAPSGELGATAIRRWTDTRIVVNIPIREEGRYWLGILGYRDAAGPAPSPGGTLIDPSPQEVRIAFDAVLPTPTITGYGTPAVCPGATFTIYGNNFGNAFGMFTILWVKIGEDREYRISIREDAILRWTDSEIRFRLPNDLPGYVSPGVPFRIGLGKPGARSSLTIVARGPDSRLAENCDVAEARVPGRSPQIASRLAVTFTLGPLQRTASVGDQIVFGGGFDAAPELQSRLRSSPLTVEWRIVRQGESRAAAGDRVQLRDRRTPFLVRALADHAGTYSLELTMLNPPRDVLFRPDLSAAMIQVNPKLLNQQINPATAKQPPKGALPGMKAPELQFPANP